MRAVYAQGLVWTDEVIVGQHPVQMPGQGRFTSRQRPSATGQGCREFTEREVETLDEGGLDLAGEAESKESARKESQRRCRGSPSGHDGCGELKKSFNGPVARHAVMRRFMS